MRGRGEGARVDVRDLKREILPCELGRHVAVLAGTKIRPAWGKVAIGPLEIGALLVTRPNQVASIVEDGQQDVVAIAAQIGIGDLVGQERCDAEGVLHRLGDDRGVFIGTVELVRRAGDKVAGIGALLAEVGRGEVMTHRTRDAIPG